MSCFPSTNSPPSDEGTAERERVEVSGSISEHTVWESGKEYYVTGDITVEQDATLRGDRSAEPLTIQPDVWVVFEKENQSDYYGITVEGMLIADGGDSTTGRQDKR